MLAVRWCVSSDCSCSGTKLQHDVPCVVIRGRRQNGALSVAVVEEVADGSLALEVDNLSAMTGSGVVGGECVGELYVDSLLVWSTVVDSLVFFRSLVFLWRLLGLLVISKLSVDRKPCCKFVNYVA